MLSLLAASGLFAQPAGLTVQASSGNETRVSLQRAYPQTFSQTLADQPLTDEAALMRWVNAATAQQPTASETIPLSGLGAPSVHITASAYEDVRLEAALPESLAVHLATTPAVVENVGMERKKPSGTVVVRLLTYDAATQTLRRYSKIEAVITSQPDLNKTVACENSQLGVSNSVLANGRWFKFPVTEEGVYKIDAAWLTAAGVTGTVDWTKIQVFGNGGMMLPASNCNTRPADLQAVPVMRASDGVYFHANSLKNWTYDTVNNQWRHELNVFSTENVYFVRVDAAAQRLVQMATEPAQTNPQRLTTAEGRWFIEEDKDNIGGESGSGLDWLGTVVSGGGTYTPLDQVLEGLTNGLVRYRTRVVVRANPSPLVSIENASASILASYYAWAVDLNASTDIKATSLISSFSQPATAGVKQTVKIRLQNVENGPRAWLDWLEAIYPRSLTANNQYLRFVTPSDQVGETEFALSGFPSAPVVWDVTNHNAVVQLPVTESGGAYLIRLNLLTDVPREIVAFTTASTNILKPGTATAVTNQNLHGISVIPDFVIVTPSEFKTQAEELAAYRRQDGLTVEVVDIEHIRNEFGGGLNDMRAMRDYFKYLYDRDTAGKFRYVLFFGDGHYDYRNIKAKAGTLKNWIPAYETVESLDPETSFTSDDYFGLLDDYEGIWPWILNSYSGNERLDIGIGRFVVQTVTQANNVLRKIKHYENPSTFGAWRTRFTFVADDDIAGSRGSESDLHTQNADQVAELVDAYAPDINLNKVYAISYNPVITALGRRVPEARTDLLRAFDEGTLIWNYSGHGGSEELADEKLLVQDDVEGLTNFDKLTVLVTATCSFGHWDYNDKQSGAELMLLNSDGGAVAVFTTVRVVYTSREIDSLNPGLNRQLIWHLMTREPNGLPRRLGDALRLTKNTTAGAQDNNRKFNLFGDPTMRIGLPTQKVTVDQMNGQTMGDPNVTITLRALDHVTVQGRVLKADGQTDTAFNGQIEVQVFDAERYVRLRSYDKIPQYRVQKDLIYRGKVTVQNGTYNLVFVSPKDISYSNRTGRISVYATSANEDAIGNTEQFIVGGTSTTPIVDTKGPSVSLFLNDETFYSGGLTHAQPKLIVKLFDENGLNTVGTGIGHQLLLVVDGNEANAQDLGQYFTGDANSYQSGRVVFQLPELPAGRHTLTVKAWDVMNNATLATLEFVVGETADLKIRNLANYPNPTVGPTRFIVEHNQSAGKNATAELKIFTISGRLIRSIPTDELIPGGLLQGSTLQYQWDGRDENGDALATGVYLYKVRMGIETEDGAMQYAEQIEKLALIR